MTRASRSQRQGQPLVAIVGILLAWTGMRVAWQGSIPGVPDMVSADVASRPAGKLNGPVAGKPPKRIIAFVGGEAFAESAFVVSEAADKRAIEPISVSARLDNAHREPTAFALPQLLVSSSEPYSGAPETISSPETVKGEGESRAFQAPPRWSGDAWLFWRPGSSGLASATSNPVYGGSQAGAVLRYALAPGSDVRPSAYLRVVQAVDLSQDGDVAAGLAFRPMWNLPLTAHGEMRVSRRSTGLELRPAAFISGGIDDVPLTRGISARGYAQAGYVGGRDQTGFVDGSIVAEAQVLGPIDVPIAIGAGAWGGAQRGGGRLDAGPSASVRLRIGNASARLSADYRVRVAGDAAPSSGAAVTLAAGF